MSPVAAGKSYWDPRRPERSHVSATNFAANTISPSACTQLQVSINQHEQRARCPETTRKFSQSHRPSVPKRSAFDALSIDAQCGLIHFLVRSGSIGKNSTPQLPAGFLAIRERAILTSAKTRGRLRLRDQRRQRRTFGKRLSLTVET